MLTLLINTLLMISQIKGLCIRRRLIRQRHDSRQRRSGARHFHRLAQPIQWASHPRNTPK
jgi:hypothetical protein